MGHVSISATVEYFPRCFLENAEGFYWHLKSLTHTSEQFKSKGFRAQGESLQYLHKMAPTRATQYSIDCAYQNFRIRPLDTNKHICPGKACRLC